MKEIHSIFPLDDDFGCWYSTDKKYTEQFYHCILVASIRISTEFVKRIDVVKDDCILVCSYPMQQFVIVYENELDP